MKTIIFLTLIFISVHSTAQIPSYVPSNGLVGWWPFNGNANDESGNINNGTVNGATLTTDRNGITNSAFSFDGINDFIEVAHNQSLNCSSVSISLWFNTNNFIANNGYGPHLLSKRESVGWGGSYQMNLGINQSQNACWADWTISGNGGIYFDSSNFLTSGNWFNLVYTHDGTNVKLFLNGGLVETIVSPGLLNFNDLPLWFGARPNAGNNSSWFNGSIDDIGIWDHALTNCEIQDLYNSQLGSSNTSSSQTQTAFDTYIWPVNNQTYTQSGTYSDTIVNAAGCDSIITLNLTLEYTGIDEHNAVNVLVSPNPITNQFSISGIEQIVSLTLMDMNGKIVKSLNEKEKSHDVSNLNPGMYFLEVRDENQSYMIKVMKD